MIERFDGRADASYEILAVPIGFEAWDAQSLLLDLESALRRLFRTSKARFPYALYSEWDEPTVSVAPAPPGMNVDRATVKTYLASAIMPDGRSALDRWTVVGAAGKGALVAFVLAPPPATSVAPADYYSAFDTGDGLPAIVAVQVGASDEQDRSWGPYGHLWQKAILRAVGQGCFGLRDEYEYPGDAFARPPSLVPGGFGNVVVLSETQRAALQGATPPKTVALLGDSVDRWGLGDGDALAFFPHAGSDADVSNAGPLATLGNQDPCQDRALYEGGAGYRTYVVRGAADCLMHRIPSSSSLPVLADVDFCPVCHNLIAEAVEAGDDRSFRRQTTLAAQSTEFDLLRWPAAPERLTGPDVKLWVTTDKALATQPRWGLNGRIVAAPGQGVPGGLVLESVTLENRPDDPFANSPDVFERIAFQDLAVRIGGNRVPLSVADALDGAGDLAPELLIQRAPAAFKAQLGYQLKLRWMLQGWQIEASMSVVFMGPMKNVDPGSAVVGCKIYPQLAMRCVRPAAPEVSLQPVDALDGTVSVTMNNVVRPADADAMATAMGHDPSQMTGMRMVDALDASFFTDGNDLHGDAVYGTTSQPGTGVTVPLSLVIPGVPVTSPAFSMVWQRGRRIAGVQAFGSAVMAVLRSVAYLGHALRKAPILPFWSWLFDYAQPRVAAAAGDTASYVGVWAADETTPGGRAGTATAQLQLPYPQGRDFADLSTLTPVPQPFLGHTRYARQGTWDNIHVTPPMGMDAKGREIISAPVCADKCFHLHWRWGADGLRTTEPDFVPAPERFKGWSHSGLPCSNAVFGAPLIPPNQHLDVTVSRASDAEFEIRYATSARKPGESQWQVSLEQGGAFAYSYQGISGGQYAALVFGVLGTVETDTSAAARRRTFPKVYSRLRWFDPDEDGALRPTVQQIPTPADLSAADWQKLRDA